MAIELSQKCQYALRAVFELARRYNEGPVKISEVAEAQAIPPRFLENILNQLKRDGIVDSRRGKTGGYVLATPPENLTVGTVIELIQGPLSVVECDGGTPGEQCPFENDCVFWPLWRKAHKVLRDVYYGETFANLVEKENHRLAAKTPDYSI
ncbi:MAG: RrF2 family transcriptional regulator [Lentisphaeria bacterium]